MTHLQSINRSIIRRHHPGKISVFARQREIARTRESATAAEGESK
jgi:hypothetical protein